MIEFVELSDTALTVAALAWIARLGASCEEKFKDFSKHDNLFPLFAAAGAAEQGSPIVYQLFTPHLGQILTL